MIITKGIGTRIKKLVTAISYGETYIGWPVNSHCPVGASEIFPNGIEGVEINNITTRNYTHKFRPRREVIKLPAAWKLVWESFENIPLEKHPCGIHFRSFHCGGKPWSVFKSDITNFAANYEGKVFVLADAMRDEIQQILGDRMVHPSTKPLAFDYDRPVEQVLAHLKDWRQFVLTASAISSHPRPAVMWARRFSTNN